MSRTILIFGAGLNQLTLIEAARQLGIRSVVIDPAENPPGKAVADVYYKVGAQDYELTKIIAIQENVEGIVTTQMENPLRLMAKLANEMGYLFHSQEVVEQCRNKFKMKQVFFKNNVSCATGILVPKGHLVTQRFLSTKKLHFPLIVKPIDAHSSRGVRKVNTINELRIACENAFSFSSSGDALVEEFMDGREFSVETITSFGSTHIIQITEKILTDYPTAVELGHLQPADLTMFEMQEIEKLTIKAIKSLQIDNSAAHTEIKYSKEGFKVVEVGARSGGDFISSYLTYASTGINMDRAVIQVSLGEIPDLMPQYKRISLIRYIQLLPGSIVECVLPIDEILSIPGVIFAQIFVSPGSIIQPIEHSAQRPACFIITGNTMNEVKENAFIVENKLKQLIKIKNNVN
jgi:biotin carboxylase